MDKAKIAHEAAERGEYGDGVGLNLPVEMPSIIVCAAIRRGDIIICGARHFDTIMSAQLKRARLSNKKWECGFIDQYGTFIGRAAAWQIANRHRQIRRPTTYETEFLPQTENYGDDGILFSENLY